MAQEIWAKKHLEFFPVRINSAGREDLLRVPGLGPITVRKILKMRKKGRISSILDVAKPSLRLEKAAAYLDF